MPGQTSTTTARALRWAPVVILLLAGFGGADARAQQAGATTIDGVSASGSRWRIDMPADWNGRLLLYSHGWSPVVRDPAVAPPGLREANIWTKLV